jgi:hypothetical protein
MPFLGYKALYSVTALERSHIMFRPKYQYLIALALIVVLAIGVSFAQPASRDRADRRSDSSSSDSTEQTKEAEQAKKQQEAEQAKQQQEAQEQSRKQQEAERAKQQQEAQEQAKKQQEAQQAKQQQEAQEQAKKQQEAQQAKQQQEAQEQAKKQQENERAKQAQEQTGPRHQPSQSQTSNSSSGSNPGATKETSTPSAGAGKTDSADKNSSTDASRSNGSRRGDATHNQSSTQTATNQSEKSQPSTDSTSKQSDSGSAANRQAHRTETTTEKKPVTDTNSQLNSSKNTDTNLPIGRQRALSDRKEGQTNTTQDTKTGSSQRTAANRGGRRESVTDANSGTKETQSDVNAIKTVSSRTPRRAGVISSIPEQPASTRQADANSQITANRQRILRKDEASRGADANSVKVNHEHRYVPVKPVDLTYRDRPYSRNSHHYELTYADRDAVIHHKTVQPGSYFVVYYDDGPLYKFSYIYPYYQRKYVFVNPWGFWPAGYKYARYYWYSCHPYYWYGYYPLAYEMMYGAYNFYTYNYYYIGSDSTEDTSQVVDLDYSKYVSSFKPEEPADTTLVDIYFEDGVDAFEDGDYKTAIQKFADAMEIAPEDIVLPFAYCQALLADEQYIAAAKVLRLSLEKVKPGKENVFYPRGLYAEEEVLLEHIDNLAAKTEIYSFDADLQLLLGYQLLGIGDYEKAMKHLTNASLDLEDTKAATMLLKLMNEIDIEKNTEPSEQLIPPPIPEAETMFVKEDIITDNNDNSQYAVSQNASAKIVPTENKADIIPVKSSIKEQWPLNQTVWSIFLGITLLMSAVLTGMILHIKRRSA